MAEQIFALDPIAEDFPTGIGALHHALVYDWKDEPECIFITLHYRDGVLPTDPIVASVKTCIYRGTIIEAGGLAADWVSLCAKALNSSDTNDVVELLRDTEWGKNIIWKWFRRHQGQ